MQQLTELNFRTRRVLEMLYEKSEVQKGCIPDKSLEIENDIISAEQIDVYCKEANGLLDEIEERNAFV